MENNSANGENGKQKYKETLKNQMIVVGVKEYENGKQRKTEEERRHH